MASTKWCRNASHAPVEDFDPFRAVTWDAKKLGGDAAAMASTAAVAVGLALRKVGDR
jgi:Tfp pilus assembly PilM family ATPase